jgi:hypothetical protein
MTQASVPSPLVRLFIPAHDIADPNGAVVMLGNDDHDLADDNLGCADDARVSI